VTTVKRGITNVAHHMGLLGNAPDAGRRVVREFDIAEEHIANHTGGLWSRRAHPGDSVTMGSLLGTFLDPSTGEVSHPVVANKPGTILNPVASWPMLPAGQWLMATGQLVETHAIEG
jgi:predicted deacylase